MRVVFALILLASIAAVGDPCSIFKYTAEGRTYFCGNEDWTASDPAIQTVKARGSDNGYILLGWKSYLPRYVQAGINSRGLCFDWAAVPPQGYVRDSAKNDLTLDFTIDVLKRCATVDEVATYIRSYNIPHLAEEHIMFADRRGKSCVVEYAHSQLSIMETDSEHQFMTNFHLSDNALGWYPCDRYSRMQAFFAEKGNKELRLAGLLDSIHQEGQYPTVYSYIFDLSRMQITIFHNHNYLVSKRFSLDDLLSNDAVLEISF